MVAEKGSGYLTIGFACDKIVRFRQALIAGDEPKRSVKDLWGYVNLCGGGFCTGRVS